MADEQARFDVFFSYNRQDSLAVEAIAQRLQEHNLTVFLDQWYLVGGRPWTDRLESVLADCRAVVVFLGTHGMGRWQQREKDLALELQSTFDDAKYMFTKQQVMRMHQTLQGPRRGLVTAPQ